MFPPTPLIVSTPIDEKVATHPISEPLLSLLREIAFDDIASFSVIKVVAITFIPVKPSAIDAGEASTEVYM